MTEVHPLVRATLKAVMSAQTEEQMWSADVRLANAREMLNKPVTLLTAWPFPSDFPEYQEYAYISVLDSSSNTITVRVGGNAGRQALWLESKGKLPSRRMLVEVDNLYFWKKM